AAWNEDGAEDESEVVPVPVVVHVVDAHAVGEQRDDERDGQDQPLPQASPEAGDVVGVHVGDIVRASQARARGEQGERTKTGRQRDGHPPSPAAISPGRALWWMWRM